MCNFIFVSQLASDAGALVLMTESEKKRLEELLCGDNELEVSRGRMRSVALK